MKAKLTNALVVETLAKNQRVQIWDTQLTGLYAEFRANGKGTYFVSYTHPHTGKKMAVSIAPIDIISVEEARKKRVNYWVKRFWEKTRLNKKNSFNRH